MSNCQWKLKLDRQCHFQTRGRTRPRVLFSTAAVATARQSVRGMPFLTTGNELFQHAQLNRIDHRTAHRDIAHNYHAITWRS